VDVDGRDPGGRQFPAALPDDEYNVNIAVGHEDDRNNEDVGRQESEVEFALPPGSVASTGALVFDHALRVYTSRHLHIRQLHVVFELSFLVANLLTL